MLLSKILKIRNFYSTINRHRKLSTKHSENFLSILDGNPELISTSVSVLGHHGQDEGPEHGVNPELVLYPETTAQVSQIMEICNFEKIPVIPYGTGTGLEAGISAIKGGISLDLSRMNAITDFHPEDFDVTVGPGVTREALNQDIKDSGLWFSVDPGANASICGMCATGASGTNTIKYGTIKENVLNLEVVGADGSVYYTAGNATSRPRKTSAGYDLTHLIVGSEGTLGVITKAIVKLHPQPSSVAAAIVDFPDIKSAVDTVVMVLQCGIGIARIEILDDVAVKASNAYSGLNNPVKPMLFMEFHAGSDEGLKEQSDMVKDISDGNGGGDFQWAVLQEDRNKLWTARHKLYYASINLRAGSRAVTTDVAVPISNLPQILVETKEDIMKTGLIGPLLGHVGDGNFHAILLFDPKNEEEYRKCKQVSHRMANKAIEMGGTCTGEHGIGTGKIGLLQNQYGMNGINVMKSIKNTLDPHNILNPGKVL